MVTEGNQGESARGDSADTASTPRTSPSDTPSSGYFSGPKKVGIIIFMAIVLLAIMSKCSSPSPSGGSNDTASTLDKVVYGTVLKIDMIQGLDPLGFKEEMEEITLLEDCQVVGAFDRPPDCDESSKSSQVVTLSIPKGKMYGPEIRLGDYIATRWSCRKTDMNSCVFVKYADGMSGSREEGIH